MENLLKALRSIILQNVDVDIFPAKNIMYGFQTPTSNNFISYLILHSRKTGITDVKTYDPTENIEAKTSVQLYENHIQIDCYSDDFFNAPNAAQRINQYLTAFASDYLQENFSGITVGVVDEVMNLTEVGDKGKYLSRYVVRFSLFTHQEITLSQAYIDEVNVALKWIS